MFRSAGGKLRKGTSGVDRSQAACVFEATRPREGDWSDLWLKRHRKARSETLDRRMVTAAEHVYSTWESADHRRRDGKTIYRDRPAPQPVHLLRAIGERQELPERMEAGEPAAVCEEAPAQRRSGRGSNGQYPVVL